MNKNINCTMDEDKELHPGKGKNGTAYDINYFEKKHGISRAEVEMALREIHYGSAEQLDEWLKLKYKKLDKHFG